MSCVSIKLYHYIFTKPIMYLTVQTLYLQNVQHTAFDGERSRFHHAVQSNQIISWLFLCTVASEAANAGAL